MERHLKGAFVSYGAADGPPTVIAFQFNPELLTRSVSAPDGPVGAVASAPEVITFTLSLDAVEFSSGNSDPDIPQVGLLPMLSALEGLVSRPGAENASAVVLFSWGPQRLLPVRVISLVIRETEFSPTLAPVRAVVDVVLTVIGSTDAASHPAAQKAWRRHLEAREKLLTRLPQASPDVIGRTLE